MNSNTLEQVILDRVPHPGELLTEYLEWAGWSQQDLARRTGLTAKTVSEICNAKAPVSAQTALSLEPVIGRPAHLWLGLQRSFDERQARNALISKHSQWKEWMHKFPVKEMQAHDWIDKSDVDPLNPLLSFFGVASPDSWGKTWESMRVAYRRSDLVNANKYAVSAWIRATELEASRIETADFDEARARLLIPQFRSMTRLAPESYFEAWRTACASSGIALVVLPQLKGTSISGCARWLSDSKAVIALTPRYKTDDQLWLTFFHELAHLLLHRKKYRFVLDSAEDSISDGIVDQGMVQIEREANSFADESLIPPGSFKTFVRSGVFSCPSIEVFAREIDIGAGIVVGRLQRDGLIDYSSCNQLKRRIEIAETPELGS